MRKLAVIGCGRRARAYMRHMRGELGRSVQVAAVVDPDEAQARALAQEYGEGADYFASATDCYTAMDGALDAVLIASPNGKHVEAAVPALERRLPMLLEKPVAISADQCRELWRAYEAAERPPMAVGFVLRYTPFYRRVQELVANGTLGQVLQIEATELMAPSLSSVFMRGWRRFERDAGPLLLEKCSHDLDILNWLVADRAVRVGSFGARTRFTPRADAAERCRDCQYDGTCRYSLRVLDPYRFSDQDEEEAGGAEDVNDLCVFNSEKDLPDHQVVQIEYANGVLASFTLCMDQPRTTRTLRIKGTEGQLYGDIGQDTLWIEHHDQSRPKAIPVTEMHRIAHDGTGHHGGDGVIGQQLRAMMHGEDAPPAAGLWEGIQACAVAFAAEQARHEGGVATVPELCR